MDHNDLARFLDGTLSKEERGRALAHLADSDDDADVLGDAAYLLREAEEEGGPADDGTEAHHPLRDDKETGQDPKVVPLRPPSTGRTRPRRLPVRWLALAAMVAGVLLVPLALSRSNSRAPGDFAVLLANRDGGLPEDWAKRNRWSVTRGGGETAVADNALSARLGALQVALEVAAAGGQEEEIGLLTGDIVSGLNNVAGAGPVVAAYDDIGSRAGEPADSLAAPLADARESLAMFMEEDYFNLGAWAEAAAIAVQRRDAAFFHAPASRKMLNRAASLSSIDQEARRAIDGIRASTREGEVDWVALKSNTSALLASIGS
jgi:hypothetical protein